MAHFWVTKPGEEGKLAGLEAEAARVQAELAKIQALSDEQACRICGARVELTDEHAPSKKAGNVGPMVRGVINSSQSIATGVLSWEGQMIQGAKYKTLCAPCNNATGSWYNPAYVQFARVSRSAAVPANAGRTSQLKIAHRQRVAKQALASLVATSQPGLTDRYPDLRTLLLSNHDRRAIAPLKLWLHLRANPGGVSTGITVAIDLERRTGRLVAGFSFWPLGWILTLGDTTVDGVLDVSSWTELDYNEKGPVAVDVPCQWGLSVYPAVFRGPEEYGDEPWSLRPAPLSRDSGCPQPPTWVGHWCSNAYLLEAGRLTQASARNYPRNARQQTSRSSSPPTRDYHCSERSAARGVAMSHSFSLRPRSRGTGRSVW